MVTINTVAARTNADMYAAVEYLTTLTARFKGRTACHA